MVDRVTGLSRCIGFVRFKTIEQATAAMEGMHGSPRGEATLNVKYADDERQKELRKRLRLQNTASSSTSFTHSVSPISYSMINTPASLEGRVEASRRASATTFVSVPWPAPYGWTSPVYTPVYDPAHSPWLLVYPTEGYPAPSAQHRTPQHTYSFVSNVHFPIDPNVSDIRSSSDAAQRTAEPSQTPMGSDIKEPDG